LNDHQSTIGDRRFHTVSRGRVRMDRVSTPGGFRAGHRIAELREIGELPDIERLPALRRARMAT